MQPLQIKHHSPALAAGLNWLTPGLGLYYLGHATAARWALLLTLLPGFAWLLLPRFFPQSGLILLAAGLLSLFVLLTITLISWHRARVESPVVLPASRRGYGYLLFWLSFVLLLVIWLALLVIKTGLMPLQVPGNHMSGSIKKYDWVLLERQPHAALIERGDVIWFSHPETGESVLQRVVGLPGERVAVHQGGLFINGEWQAEPYLDAMRNKTRIPEGAVASRVPENHFFVLADNRDNSRDSRFWGTLPNARIEGKVLFHLDRQRLNGRELLSFVTGHNLAD
jgi:signal peptidase I